MEITDGRAVVDRDRCEGNAVCVRIAPGVFQLDDANTPWSPPTPSRSSRRRSPSRPSPSVRARPCRAKTRRPEDHVAGEEDRRRTPCTRVNTRPHTTSGLIGGAGTKHDGRDTLRYQWRKAAAIANPSLDDDAKRRLAMMIGPAATATA